MNRDTPHAWVQFICLALNVVGAYFLDSAVYCVMRRCPRRRRAYLYCMCYDEGNLYVRPSSRGFTIWRHQTSIVL